MGFALARAVHYDLYRPMTTSPPLLCDGCGQAASPDHFARRLQRLEWATRYRPVHMQALLLSGVSPAAAEEFLYFRGAGGGTSYEGEAAWLLSALGISHKGKPAEDVLTEFQRRGLFLTHALECPMEFGPGDRLELATLLETRFNDVCVKIRRSLKPKRVVILSSAMRSIANRFAAANLGCPVELDEGKPFDLESAKPEAVAARLRAVLPAIATAARP
ncbi:MAG: hypothetical protein PVS2B2_16220 [Candidatus Acidiferrum sp.]